MKTNPPSCAPPQEADKWIEWIRVRSSKAALTAAMPSIESQVADLEAAAVGTEAHLLRHALYDGDLAVVLIWRGTGATPSTTREGLMVAEQLQRLGSVDHAVWVPTENSPQKTTSTQTAA